MTLADLYNSYKTRSTLLIFSVILTTLTYAQVPEDAIFKNGDLEISFVTLNDTNYINIWDPKGSGANAATTFARPKLTDMPDFHTLGDLVLSYSYDPTGSVMAVVRDASSAGDILVSPTSYDYLWNDRLSGANRNISVWQPVCPDGYVAMGLVTNSHLTNPPSLDAVKCIHSGYVVEATTGSYFWGDNGSGASANFSAWAIKAPTVAAGSGKTHISPGTFIGHRAYTKPDHVKSYALIIPIADSTPVDADDPQRPTLSSYNEPNKFSDNGTISVTYLPWFTVRDTVLTAAEQISTTPTYRMVRETRYKRIFFLHNETSTTNTVTETYTWGTSSSASEAYSRKTGIEMTLEWDPPLSPFSASATLSAEFTHTTETTTAWSKESSNSLSVPVAPNSASAAYLLESRYTLFRKDGSTVYQELDHSPSNSYFTTSFTRTANLSQVNLPALEVYPTLATFGENIHIVLPTSEAYQLDIIDLSGKVVYSRSDILNELNLNSSELHQGMFIIRVYNDNQTFDRKIMVQ